MKHSTCQDTSGPNGRPDAEFWWPRFPKARRMRAVPGKAPAALTGLDSRDHRAAVYLAIGLTSEVAI